MNLIKLDLIQPTEENNYCVFSSDFEDDPEVFFHATKSSNLQAIINFGFLSAKELKSGNLESVSYAKRSFSCLAHFGCKFSEEAVIFAVRFTEKDLKNVAIVKNHSDIHVYDKEIQPIIEAYVLIPKGFDIT